MSVESAQMLRTANANTGTRERIVYANGNDQIDAHDSDKLGISVHSRDKQSRLRPGIAISITRHYWFYGRKKMYDRRKMIIYTYTRQKISNLQFISLFACIKRTRLCKKKQERRVKWYVWCSWSKNYLLKVSFPRRVIIFTKTVLLRHVVKMQRDLELSFPVIRECHIV